MRSRLQMRWVTAGGIWLTALALTYWNTFQVEVVVAVREQNEQLRQEASFQRHNARELAQILRARNALMLPAESVDLAVVVARSRLGALAAAFELGELEMRAELHQQATGSEGQVPYNLSLKGPLDNAMGFLTALRNYPYFVLQRTKIKDASDAAWVNMEIGIDLRYRIEDAGDNSNPVPRAIPHGGQSEAEPL
jgi:hypothetical protein